MNPKEQDESKKIGSWELLSVGVVENAQEKRYRIVYCEYDENDRKQPQKQYAYFSKFAKGELKLYGTYIHRPISTGGLGSGKPYGEVIRGNFVYKFRIDIIDGSPKMMIFENGVFEIHPDSEIQEVAN